MAEGDEFRCEECGHAAPLHWDMQTDTFGPCVICDCLPPQAVIEYLYGERTTAR